MARRLSKKAKRNILISILIFAVLITVLIIWREPLFRFFTNKEYVEKMVESAGIFGPLIFVVLQILQVVLAPIPGQAVGFIGGYLFGTFWGTVLSLIGSTIGFAIIFIIARKFGRPLIERILNKDLIEKFDYITKKNGVLILFLIFLLPTFPDDAIGYLAGLSEIPLSQLMLISFAGRVPGILVLSLLGSGLSHNSIRPIISIAIATILLLAFFYWKRKWLAEFVKSDNHIRHIRKTWPFKRIKTALLILAILVIVTALTLFAIF